VLGRLDDFTTPTLLSRWLTEVSDEESWYKKAVEHVYLKITST
jgi:hypothetical protein